MQHELKLWEFIPGADFEIPCSPSKETARGHSQRFWRWLQQDVLTQSKEGASSESAELNTPSADQRQAASIEPAWDEAAKTLFAALSQWFESQSDHGSACAFVGPVGFGVANMLHALAEERQLKVLSPPPLHAILNDVDSYRSILQSLDESADEVLVIPQLERFYLRHEDGLNLVRNVAERLMSRRRVLLGCDSWAWAFLQQAIGVEHAVGKPMTVAPFDDQRLDNWFRSSYDLQKIEFRQRHDDKPVFPPRPEGSRRDPESAQAGTSDWIKSLAVRARGNLGVALALWHSSLRTHDPNPKESEPVEQTSQLLYWVESLSELELPTLFNNFDEMHRFVLHAILLHGGLSLSMLVTLLPFSREDISRRVSELRTAGLLHEQNDTLQVTLTAYPEVHQDLVSEGFLADAF